MSTLFIHFLKSENVQTMKTFRFQAWLSIALVALVAGVVVPSQALGAACPDMSGKVVKVKSSYWLVRDAQRYEFVDLTAMQTWDKTPLTVSAECVKDLPVVGFINYRPGSRLVKKAGEATVYAVGPQMMLHPIDAVAARQWYGPSWKSLVKNLPAEKFAKFTVDEALTVDRVNDGALVRAANKPQVYYVKGGLLVKVEGKLRPALSGKVLVLPVKVFAKLQVTTGSVKAADIAAEPVTATVLVQEGTAPVVTPPVTPPTTPVTPVTPGTDPVVTPVTPTAPVNPPGTNGSTPRGNTTVGELLKLPRFGANYNGPFPAPEGMVLKGTIGENIFFKPTGSGAYQFKPEISRGGLSLNCLDDSRRVIGSKGKNYDLGFEAGIPYGLNDRNKIGVPFNDTPRGGGNLTNQYFKEGFRAGYVFAYDTGRNYDYKYSCNIGSLDISLFDVDGWKKTTDFKQAPNLKVVYYPDTHGSYDGGDGKKEGEIYKWTIRAGYREKIEESEPNKGKTAVNISEVFMSEAVLEGEEKTMNGEQLAKLVYDVAVANNKPMSFKCALSEPTIATKQWGQNTVTGMGYVIVCGKGSSATWQLVSTYLIKGKTSGNVLTVNVVNPNNLKKSGADELDESKLSSVSFIEQFFSKIQFN